MIDQSFNTKLPFLHRAGWSRKTTFLLVLLVEGGLGVLSCILGYFLNHNPLNTINLSAIDFITGIIAALPLFFIFILMFRLPVQSIKKIIQLLEKFHQLVLNKINNFELIIVSVFAGAGEEMFFRGMLQISLNGVAGNTGGLILSGILFGFAHFITPVYAIIAACIGVYLGWIFMETGNLLVPIVTHAFYDYLAFLYFKKYYGSKLCI